MIKIKKLLVVFGLLFNFTIYANVSVTLSDVYVNLEDLSAVKRGSRIFFDYCQGCHSLKYMRYADLAQGLNFNTDTNKKIREYFLHSTDAVSENTAILTTMTKDSAKWFGKTPPDLSLVTRYRGVNWLYSYMISFYKDNTRPWGVNNLVFPDVGMPHVLLKLQGVQVLNDKSTVDDDLFFMFRTLENGIISKEKYNELVLDLVTFLSYVAEPNKVTSEKIGMYVIIYFIILAIILFMLKKSYWEDIK